jgi:hypothetical protein
LRPKASLRSETPKEAQRDRRRIYREVDRMERALAAVWLACAELSPLEKMVVLQSALTEAVEAHKQQHPQVGRK